MDNGKQKMESERREANHEKFSVFHFGFSDQKVCSACGTQAQREFAKYCLVCGKFLQEDYQPLDSLRASNRLAKFGLKTEVSQKKEIENLFEENSRATSLTWAFVVYSMVPYLGILFCPGALLLSGAGVFVELRKPFSENRKMAVYSIILSLVILTIQILLWWLLYLIPELNRNI